MALITCRNCGHTVSDEAPACPACGTPPTRTFVQPVPATTPPLSASGASPLIAINVGTVPATTPVVSPAPPPGEKELWTGSPSSKRIVAALQTPVLFGLGVGGIVLAATHLMLDSPSGGGQTDDGTLNLAVAGLMLLAIIIAAVRSLRDTAGRGSDRYILSNQRLRQAGLLAPWEVDLREIEAVSASTNWIKNILGIGNIKVFSAKKKVHRLFDVEAPQDVREQIRTAVYDVTGRRPDLRE